MSEKKQHWENVYRNKSPLEVSWYQQEPVLSLLLITSTQLSRGAPIIDVGGGSSTLVDKLYDQAYTDISVLDISGSALAHAKKRLANKADKVHWYETDVTHFKPPQKFALWHDRAVFHFLPVRRIEKAMLMYLNKHLNRVDTL